MHRYRIFGLTIASDIALDEASPERDAERAIDLIIERGHIGYPLPAVGEAPHFDFGDPDGTLMVWPAAGIRIRDNTHIVVQSPPHVPESYLAFPLLGPVMGWLLHRRGMLVLHAGAFVLNGRGIALLGDKGAGKSTTTAAFIAAGASLLTDDLLAMSVTQDARPCIHPAFPQIKLNSGSSFTLEGANIRRMPLIERGFGKRQYRLDAMAEDPTACDYIFVLERGAHDPGIEWYDGADALRALIRFSYNVRFDMAPIVQQERGRHMRQCARIADTTRIGTLHVPPGIDRLDEVIALVARTVGDDGG